MKCHSMLPETYCSYKSVQSKSEGESSRTERVRRRSEGLLYTRENPYKVHTLVSVHRFKNPLYN